MTFRENKRYIETTCPSDDVYAAAALSLHGVFLRMLEAGDWTSETSPFECESYDRAMQAFISVVCIVSCPVPKTVVLHSSGEGPAAFDAITAASIERTNVNFALKVVAQWVEYDTTELHTTLANYEALLVEVSGALGKDYPSPPADQDRYRCFFYPHTTYVPTLSPTDREQVIAMNDKCGELIDNIEGIGLTLRMRIAEGGRA